ncbi:hypothetical protein Val02_45210 [Virgisporangium aliadipatigenens]|uniref:Uncharacterized protein n=1 Tax=Virgisporangium aliadipatigenens TaxID=741659 RepID=A0A8J4DR09_9ACTN|nr:hypothetical protein [Virgisporangium aliadipatigenens]GIJ47635.1 hypothetical protein Val02_45210 [Virgisporangium aliadipatigenens]
MAQSDWTDWGPRPGESWPPVLYATDEYDRFHPADADTGALELLAVEFDEQATRLYNLQNSMQWRANSLNWWGDAGGQMRRASVVIQNMLGQAAAFQQDVAEAIRELIAEIKKGQKQRESELIIQIVFIGLMILGLALAALSGAISAIAMVMNMAFSRLAQFLGQLLTTILRISIPNAIPGFLAGALLGGFSATITSFAVQGIVHGIRGTEFKPDAVNEIVNTLTGMAMGGAFGAAFAPKGSNPNAFHMKWDWQLFKLPQYRNYETGLTGTSGINGTGGAGNTTGLSGTGNPLPSGGPTGAGAFPHNPGGQNGLRGGNVPSPPALPHNTGGVEAPSSAAGRDINTSSSGGGGTAGLGSKVNAGHNAPPQQQHIPSNSRPASPVDATATPSPTPGSTRANTPVHFEASPSNSRPVSPIDFDSAPPTRSVSPDSHTSLPANQPHGSGNAPLPGKNTPMPSRLGPDPHEHSSIQSHLPVRDGVDGQQGLSGGLHTPQPPSRGTTPDPHHLNNQRQIDDLTQHNGFTNGRQGFEGSPTPQPPVSRAATPHDPPQQRNEVHLNGTDGAGLGGLHAPHSRGNSPAPEAHTPLNPRNAVNNGPDPNDVNVRQSFGGDRSGSNTPVETPPNRPGVNETGSGSTPHVPSRRPNSGNESVSGNEHLSSTSRSETSTPSLRQGDLDSGVATPVDPRVLGGKNGTAHPATPEQPQRTVFADTPLVRPTPTRPGGSEGGVHTPTRQGTPEPDAHSTTPVPRGPNGQVRGDADVTDHHSSSGRTDAADLDASRPSSRAGDEHVASSRADADSLYSGRSQTPPPRSEVPETSLVQRSHTHSGDSSTSPNAADGSAPTKPGGDRKPDYTPDSRTIESYQTTLGRRMNHFEGDRAKLNEYTRTYADNLVEMRARGTHPEQRVDKAIADFQRTSKNGGDLSPESAKAVRDGAIRRFENLQSENAAIGIKPKLWKMENDVDRALTGIKKELQSHASLDGAQVRARQDFDTAFDKHNAANPGNKLTGGEKVTGADGTVTRQSGGDYSVMLDKHLRDITDGHAASFKGKFGNPAERFRAQEAEIQQRLPDRLAEQERIKDFMSTRFADELKQWKTNNNIKHDDAAATPWAKRVESEFPNSIRGEDGPTSSRPADRAEWENAAAQKAQERFTAEHKAFQQRQADEALIDEMLKAHPRGKGTFDQSYSLMVTEFKLNNPALAKNFTKSHEAELRADYLQSSVRAGIGAKKSAGPDGDHAAAWGRRQDAIDGRTADRIVVKAETARQITSTRAAIESRYGIELTPEQIHRVEFEQNRAMDRAYRDAFGDNPGELASRTGARGEQSRSWRLWEQHKSSLDKSLEVRMVHEANLDTMLATAGRDFGRLMGRTERPRFDITERDMAFLQGRYRSEIIDAYTRRFGNDGDDIRNWSSHEGSTGNTFGREVDARRRLLPDHPAWDLPLGNRLNSLKMEQGWTFELYRFGDRMVGWVKPPKPHADTVFDVESGSVATGNRGFTMVVGDHGVPVPNEVVRQATAMYETMPKNTRVHIFGDVGDLPAGTRPGFGDRTPGGTRPADGTGAPAGASHGGGLRPRPEGSDAATMPRPADNGVTIRATGAEVRLDVLTPNWQRDGGWSALRGDDGQITTMVGPNGTLFHFREGTLESVRFEGTNITVRTGTFDLSGRGAAHDATLPMWRPELSERAKGVWTDTFGGGQVIRSQAPDRLTSFDTFVDGRPTAGSFRGDRFTIEWGDRAVLKFGDGRSLEFDGTRLTKLVEADGRVLADGAGSLTYRVPGGVEVEFLDGKLVRAGDRVTTFHAFDRDSRGTYGLYRPGGPDDARIGPARAGETSFDVTYHPDGGWTRNYADGTRVSADPTGLHIVRITPDRHETHYVGRTKIFDSADSRPPSNIRHDADGRVVGSQVPFEPWRPDVPTSGPEGTALWKPKRAASGDLERLVSPRGTIYSQFGRGGVPGQGVFDGEHFTVARTGYDVPARVRSEGLEFDYWRPGMRAGVLEGDRGNLPRGWSVSRGGGIGDLVVRSPNGVEYHGFDAAGMPSRGKVPGGPTFEVLAIGKRMVPFDFWRTPEQGRPSGWEVEGDATNPTKVTTANKAVFSNFKDKLPGQVTLRDGRTLSMTAEPDGSITYGLPDGRRVSVTVDADGSAAVRFPSGELAQVRTGRSGELPTHNGFEGDLVSHVLSNRKVVTVRSVAGDSADGVAQGRPWRFFDGRRSFIDGQESLTYRLPGGREREFIDGEIVRGADGRGSRFDTFDGANRGLRGSYEAPDAQAQRQVGAAGDGLRRFDTNYQNEGRIVRTYDDRTTVTVDNTGAVIRRTPDGGVTRSQDPAFNGSTAPRPNAPAPTVHDGDLRLTIPGLNVRYDVFDRILHRLVPFDAWHADGALRVRGEWVPKYDAKGKLESLTSPNGTVYSRFNRDGVPAQGVHQGERFTVLRTTFDVPARVESAGFRFDYWTADMRGGLLPKGWTPQHDTHGTLVSVRSPGGVTYSHFTGDGGATRGSLPDGPDFTVSVLREPTVKFDLWRTPEQGRPDGWEVTGDAGRPTSVTTVDGTIYSGFNSRGPTRVELPDGRKLRMEIDKDGAVTYRLPNDRQVTVTHEADGTATVRLPEGRTARVGKGEQADFPVKDGKGDQTRFTFDDGTTLDVATFRYDRIVEKTHTPTTTGRPTRFFDGLRTWEEGTHSLTYRMAGGQEREFIGGELVRSVDGRGSRFDTFDTAGRGQDGSYRFQSAGNDRVIGAADPKSTVHRFSTEYGSDGSMVRTYTDGTKITFAGRNKIIRQAPNGDETVFVDNKPQGGPGGAVANRGTGVNYWRTYNFDPFFKAEIARVGGDWRTTYTADGRLDTMLSPHGTQYRVFGAERVPSEALTYTGERIVVRQTRFDVPARVRSEGLEFDFWRPDMRAAPRAGEASTLPAGWKSTFDGNGALTVRSPKGVTYTEFTGEGLPTRGVLTDGRDFSVSFAEGKVVPFEFWRTPEQGRPAGWEVTGSGREQTVRTPNGTEYSAMSRSGVPSTVKLPDGRTLTMERGSDGSTAYKALDGRTVTVAIDADGNATLTLPGGRDVTVARGENGVLPKGDDVGDVTSFGFGDGKLITVRAETFQKQVDGTATEVTVARATRFFTGKREFGEGDETLTYLLPGNRELEFLGGDLVRGSDGRGGRFDEFDAEGNGVAGSYSFHNESNHRLVGPGTIGEVTRFTQANVEGGWLRTYSDRSTVQGMGDGADLLVLRNTADPEHGPQRFLNGQLLGAGSSTDLHRPGLGPDYEKTLGFEPFFKNDTHLAPGTWEREAFPDGRLNTVTSPKGTKYEIFGMENVPTRGSHGGMRFTVQQTTFDVGARVRSDGLGIDFWRPDLRAPVRSGDGTKLPEGWQATFDADGALVSIRTPKGVEYTDFEQRLPTKGRFEGQDFTVSHSAEKTVPFDFWRTPEQGRPGDWTVTGKAGRPESVTTGDGTRFTNFGPGNVPGRVELPDGRTLSMEAKQGGAVEYRLPDGRKLTVTVDAAGKATFRLPEGRSVEVERGAQGIVPDSSSRGDLMNHSFANERTVSVRSFDFIRKIEKVSTPATAAVVTRYTTGGRTFEEGQATLTYHLPAGREFEFLDGKLVRSADGLGTRFDEFDADGNGLAGSYQFRNPSGHQRVGAQSLGGVQRFTQTNTPEGWVRTFTDHTKITASGTGSGATTVRVTPGGDVTRFENGKLTVGTSADGAVSLGHGDARVAKGLGFDPWDGRPGTRAAGEWRMEAKNSGGLDTATSPHGTIFRDFGPDDQPTVMEIDGVRHTVNRTFFDVPARVRSDGLEFDFWHRDMRVSMRPGGDDALPEGWTVRRDEAGVATSVRSPKGVEYSKFDADGRPALGKLSNGREFSLGYPQDRTVPFDFWRAEGRTGEWVTKGRAERPTSVTTNDRTEFRDFRDGTTPQEMKLPDGRKLTLESGENGEITYRLPDGRKVTVTPEADGAATIRLPDGTTHTAQSGKPGVVPDEHGDGDVVKHVFADDKREISVRTYRHDETTDGETVHKVVGRPDRYTDGDTTYSAERSLTYDLGHGRDVEIIAGRPVRASDGRGGRYDVFDADGNGIGGSYTYLNHRTHAAVGPLKTDGPQRFTEVRAEDGTVTRTYADRTVVTDDGVLITRRTPDGWTTQHIGDVKLSQTWSRAHSDLPRREPASTDVKPPAPKPTTKTVLTPKGRIDVWHPDVESRSAGRWNTSYERDGRIGTVTSPGKTSYGKFHPENYPTEGRVGGERFDVTRTGFDLNRYLDASSHRLDMWSDAATKADSGWRLTKDADGRITRAISPRGTVYRGFDANNQPSRGTTRTGVEFTVAHGKLAVYRFGGGAVLHADGRRPLRFTDADGNALDDGARSLTYRFRGSGELEFVDGKLVRGTDGRGAEYTKFDEHGRGTEGTYTFRSREHHLRTGPDDRFAPQSFRQEHTPTRTVRTYEDRTTVRMRNTGDVLSRRTPEGLSHTFRDGRVIGSDWTKPSARSTATGTLAERPAGTRIRPVDRVIESRGGRLDRFGVDGRGVAGVYRGGPGRERFGPEASGEQPFTVTHHKDGATVTYRDGTTVTLDGRGRPLTRRTPDGWETTFGPGGKTRTRIDLPEPPEKSKPVVPKKRKKPVSVEMPAQRDPEADMSLPFRPDGDFDSGYGHLRPQAGQDASATTPLRRAIETDRRMESDGLRPSYTRGQPADRLAPRPVESYLSEQPRTMYGLRTAVDSVTTGGTGARGIAVLRRTEADGGQSNRVFNIGVDERGTFVVDARTGQQPRGLRNNEDGVVDLLITRSSATGSGSTSTALTAPRPTVRELVSGATRTGTSVGGTTPTTPAAPSTGTTPAASSTSAPSGTAPGDGAAPFSWMPAQLSPSDGTDPVTAAFGRDRLLREHYGRLTPATPQGGMPTASAPAVEPYLDHTVYRSESIEALREAMGDATPGSTATVFLPGSGPDGTTLALNVVTLDDEVAFLDAVTGAQVEPPADAPTVYFVPTDTPARQDSHDVDVWGTPRSLGELERELNSTPGAGPVARRDTRGATVLAPQGTEIDRAALREARTLGQALGQAHRYVVRPGVSEEHLVTFVAQQLPENDRYGSVLDLRLAGDSWTHADAQRLADQLRMPVALPAATFDPGVGGSSFLLDPRGRPVLRPWAKSFVVLPSALQMPQRYFDLDATGEAGVHDLGEGWTLAPVPVRGNATGPARPPALWARPPGADDAVLGERVDDRTLYLGAPGVAMPSAVIATLARVLGAQPDRPGGYHTVNLSPGAVPGTAPPPATARRTDEEFAADYAFAAELARAVPRGTPALDAAVSLDRALHLRSFRPATSTGDVRSDEHYRTRRVTQLRSFRELRESMLTAQVGSRGIAIVDNGPGDVTAYNVLRDHRGVVLFDPRTGTRTRPPRTTAPVLFTATAGAVAFPLTGTTPPTTARDVIVEAMASAAPRPTRGTGPAVAPRPERRYRQRYGWMRDLRPLDVTRFGALAGAAAVDAGVGTNEGPGAADLYHGLQAYEVRTFREIQRAMLAAGPGARAFVIVETGRATPMPEGTDPAEAGGEVPRVLHVTRDRQGVVFHDPDTGGQATLPANAARIHFVPIAMPVPVPQGPASAEDSLPSVGDLIRRSRPLPGAPRPVGPLEVRTVEGGTLVSRPLSETSDETRQYLTLGGGSVGPLRRYVVDTGVTDEQLRQFVADLPDEERPQVALDLGRSHPDLDGAGAQRLADELTIPVNVDATRHDPANGPGMPHDGAGHLVLPPWANGVLVMPAGTHEDPLARVVPGLAPGPRPGTYDLGDGWLLEVHRWGLWLRPPGVADDVLPGGGRTGSGGIFVGAPGVPVPDAVLRRFTVVLDAQPDRRGGYPTRFLSPTRGIGGANASPGRRSAVAFDADYGWLPSVAQQDDVATAIAVDQHLALRAVRPGLGRPVVRPADAYLPVPGTEMPNYRALRRWMERAEVGSRGLVFVTDRAGEQRAFNIVRDHAGVIALDGRFNRQARLPRNPAAIHFVPTHTAAAATPVEGSTPVGARDLAATPSTGAVPAVAPTGTAAPSAESRPVAPMRERAFAASFGWFAALATPAGGDPWAAAVAVDREFTRARGRDPMPADAYATLRAHRVDGYGAVRDAMGRTVAGAGRGLVIVDTGVAGAPHAVFNVVRGRRGLAFLDGTTGAQAVLPRNPAAVYFVPIATRARHAFAGAGLDAAPTLAKLREGKPEQPRREPPVAELTSATVVVPDGEHGPVHALVATAPALVAAHVGPALGTDARSWLADAARVRADIGAGGTDRHSRDTTDAILLHLATRYEDPAQPVPAAALRALRGNDSSAPATPQERTALGDALLAGTDQRLLGEVLPVLLAETFAVPAYLLTAGTSTRWYADGALLHVRALDAATHGRDGVAMLSSASWAKAEGHRLLPDGTWPATVIVSRGEVFVAAASDAAGEREVFLPPHLVARISAAHVPPTQDLALYSCDVEAVPAQLADAVNRARAVLAGDEPVGALVNPSSPVWVASTDAPGGVATEHAAPWFLHDGELDEDGWDLVNDAVPVPAVTGKEWTQEELDRDQREIRAHGYRMPDDVPPLPDAVDGQWPVRRYEWTDDAWRRVDDGSTQPESGPGWAAYGFDGIYSIAPPPARPRTDQSPATHLGQQDGVTGADPRPVMTALRARYDEWNARMLATSPTTVDAWIDLGERIDRVTVGLNTAAATPGGTVPPRLRAEVEDALAAYEAVRAGTAEPRPPAAETLVAPDRGGRAMLDVAPRSMSPLRGGADVSFADEAHDYLLVDDPTIRRGMLADLLRERPVEELRTIVARIATAAGPLPAHDPRRREIALLRAVAGVLTGADDPQAPAGRDAVARVAPALAADEARDWVALLDGLAADRPERAVALGVLAAVLRPLVRMGPPAATGGALLGPAFEAARAVLADPAAVTPAQRIAAWVEAAEPSSVGAVPDLADDLAVALGVGAVLRGDATAPSAPAFGLLEGTLGASFAPLTEWMRAWNFVLSEPGGVVWLRTRTGRPGAERAFVLVGDDRSGRVVPRWVDPRSPGLFAAPAGLDGPAGRALANAPIAALALDRDGVPVNLASYRPPAKPVAERGSAAVRTPAPVRPTAQETAAVNALLAAPDWPQVLVAYTMHKQVLATAAARDHLEHRIGTATNSTRARLTTLSGVLRLSALGREDLVRAYLSAARPEHRRPLLAREMSTADGTLAKGMAELVEGVARTNGERADAAVMAAIGRVLAGQPAAVDRAFVPRYITNSNRVAWYRRITGLQALHPRHATALNAVLLEVLRC